MINLKRNSKKELLKATGLRAKGLYKSISGDKNANGDGLVPLSLSL